VIITKEQKAMLFMLTASLLFSGAAMFAKLVARLGAAEITFFRNVVGIVILLFIFKFSLPKKFDASKLHLLLFRGIIGTVALMAFFYNVGMVSLADAVTLSKTEPLFSAILGFALFSEKLDKIKIAALVIGFLGVFVIGFDKGISMAYANIIGVFGGLCAAIAYTTIRSLKDSFDHRFVVLSFMGFGTLLPLFVMLLAPYIGEGEIVRSFVTPSQKEALFLVSIGVLSAAAQVLITKAYFYAKAGVVSSVSYSTLLFGGLFGLLIGDSIPSAVGFLGIALIVASGFLIARK